MGFRADLDITEIVQQYGVLGGVSSGINYVLGDREVDLDGPQHEEIPEYLYSPVLVDSDDPVAIKVGPLTCSTCVSLMLDPIICWDANRYYQTLNVHWRATKKELREAYQRLDGQSSVYMTYVLKQLLDPEVRSAYNRTPLGEPFLDDTYVQDDIKAKAAREAGRRSREGVFTTTEEVIAEDYNYIPEGATEQVDEGARKGHDLSHPPSGASWSYGYYLWRSERADTTRLAQWQQLLISSAARRNAILDLTVGLAANLFDKYVVMMLDEQNVVFLDDQEELTEELADSAMEDLLREVNSVNPTS